MKNLIISVICIVALLISCGDSSTNPVDSKPYKITFWSNIVNSSITVKINGIAVGEITTAYPNGISGCDAVGCVTIGYDTEQEIILYASESVSGKVWQDTILVKDSCQKYKLTNSNYPPTYDLWLYTDDPSLIPITGSVNGQHFSITETYEGPDFSFSNPNVTISAYSTGAQMGATWNEKLTLKIGSNSYCFNY